MAFFRLPFIVLVAFAMLGSTGPGALAGDIFFKSPSGNIHCMLSDDPAYAGARCDIMRVTRLSFPNPPFDCD
ncbi:MAG: hypothetical protein AAGE61_09635, partial [Pseudomonadota bacterium]